MEHHLSRMQFVQTPIIPVVAELILNYPGTISLGQGSRGDNKATKLSAKETEP